MVADWRGIIIRTGGSAVDGVMAWSFNLGPEGQLEQWQGPAHHSGAILAVPPPCCSLGDTREGKEQAY